MKRYSEMSPEEYWKHIHSKRNLNGHIRLNRKQLKKALPSARHLAFFGDLSTRGKDALQCMAEIESQLENPERQPHAFQCMEYDLAELVKEASEVLKAAGELQNYLHGARQSAQTLATLQRERFEALNGKGPYKLRNR